MKLRPLDGKRHVHVRRDPPPDKTAGGIIVPIQRQMNVTNGAHCGTVVAAHKGSPPADVKPGDRVVFGLYAGGDAQVNGETLTIMQEDEIMLVLEPSTLERLC